jgi:hypothetical protein
MNAQDLLPYLQRIPFRPFRLHLDDGRIIEVRHPELMILGKRTAAVASPAADETVDVLDRVITVSLLHIVTIEPVLTQLGGSAAPGMV